MEHLLEPGQVLAVPYRSITDDPCVRVTVQRNYLSTEEARRLALHLLHASAAAETD